jgi:hypothetical protein
VLRLEVPDSLRDGDDDFEEIVPIKQNNSDGMPNKRILLKDKHTPHDI